MFGRRPVGVMLDGPGAVVLDGPAGHRVLDGQVVGRLLDGLLDGQVVGHQVLDVPGAVRLLDGQVVGVQPPGRWVLEGPGAVHPVHVRHHLRARAGQVRLHLRAALVVRVHRRWCRLPG